MMGLLAYLVQVIPSGEVAYPIAAGSVHGTSAGEIEPAEYHSLNSPAFSSNHTEGPLIIPLSHIWVADKTKP